MSPRLLLAVLLAASLAPAAALACSCAPPPPATDALAGADAVFEGRALSGPTGGESDGETPYFGAVTYEFEVLRAWKGSPEPRTTLSTSSQGSMCGRAYEKGARYLIYASRGKDGALMDSLCSRTRSSDAATDDFTALGAGQDLPAAPARPDATASDNDTAPADGSKPRAADPPKGPGSDAEEAAAAPEEAAEADAAATDAPAKPAPDEPEDTTSDDPGCSVAGGRTGLALALFLPFIGLVRRR